ncbi:MAG: hypothetical protein HOP16_16460 [Acidobacteria bacterium]|nr:hypothetical protein [Acidobacteriota bacterium]
MEQLNLPQDFVDLLEAFGHAEVRYLIIGGYAVGYHDRPRTTKDLDVLLDPDPDNIRRACHALLGFGAQTDIAAHLEAAGEDEVVWMGHPPVRVDFLKDAPGVDFGTAWARRALATWNGVSVAVLSREDLIQSKRASGREQDMIDARNLERARPGQT